MQLKKGKTNEYAKYVKKNSKDMYAKGIVDYSERWATLMEEKMAEGAELVDIADSTSHEADTDGITGFMYGCAVSGLASFWKHGEALRKWHNRETQIGNEGEEANKKGGVLNPALLTINVKTKRSK